MNTIVCVLKSGVFKPWTQKDYTVQYGPHHVQWLRDQFARLPMSQPYRFVCMTDIEVPGVETVPLKDNLPGWWSKLEIFREFRQAAYIDLDTVPLGDVASALFRKNKFVMSAHLTRRHGVNSSVMSWNGDYRFLYDKFIENKEQIMREYVFAGRWGDQDFIKDTLIASKQGPIEKFQHTLPDFVLSYKHDILNRGMSLRFGARKRVRLRGEWWKLPHIVAFHGSPKPYEVDLPWIPKLRAG